MPTMNRTSTYLALAAAFAVLAVLPARAQDKTPPAKGQAPTAAVAPAPAAVSTKELYPKVYADFLLKERMAQGQPDTPELRNAIREELNAAIAAVVDSGAFAGGPFVEQFEHDFAGGN
jgi:peptidyl-prolyl cis-trans isomerase C